MRLHGGSAINVPFSWDDPKLRKAQAKGLSGRIMEIAKAGDGATEIEYVWSAGKAGFQATADQLSTETQAFKLVVALAKRLNQVDSITKSHFHLVSSGGGLFEAQRYVSADSIPNPLRAYGKVKLEQEQIVETLQAGISSTIYRPSSVYGYVGPRGRTGLVVALLRSCITNRTAHIFGNAATMRDYVFSDDIGNHIAARIHGNSQNPQKQILASGRPTSMTEMIGLVERIQNRKISVQFESGGNNIKHNTFRRSSLPPDWSPTALESGVTGTALKLRADLLINPVPAGI